MIDILKKSIIIVIMLLSSVIINAQNFNKFTDKLAFGGDIGMSFGTYMYINVSPIVYYSVSENFVLGLGIDYTYFKDNSYPGFTYESSIWSPRLMARYFLGENIFLHAEIQQMFYQDVYGTTLNPNSWISSTRYYAGGGYRTWIGSSSYSFIMLLFDLQSDEFYFGINPQIQMGFAVGI
ncbi:MAG: hypothetical protein DRI86_02890 [Bacteroidetes bacterium]|nr:MAG: hypothetical protein DRI86_02890 [Bacteroidota bacterium]